jgi:hypothetical protein
MVNDLSLGLYQALTITGDSLSYNNMNFCSTSDTCRVTLGTTHSDKSQGITCNS